LSHFVQKLFPLGSTGKSCPTGALAGMTAATVVYPLDLMRVRLAVARGGYGYCAVLQDIIRSQGLVGLYSGLRPTLLGVAPYAGTNFAVKGALEQWYVLTEALGTPGRALRVAVFGGAHVSGDDGSARVLRAGLSNEPRDLPELPVHARVLIGALAGLLAQCATQPLDVLRRRMQAGILGGVRETRRQHRNEVQALMSIYAQEGVRGLFKGNTVNFITAPIMWGIIFPVNDLLLEWVKEQRGI